MRRSPAGFTLLEVLIALAGLGILLGVALPAFTDAVAKGRHTGVRADLVDAMVQAGTHAVVTDTRVVLCPSADGNACLTGTDWTPGWISFPDLDGDREHGGHEPLLKVRGKLEGGLRLRGSAGRTRIVFQPRGGNAGSNTTFTLCDRRGPAKAASLVIANSGNWRFGTPTAAAAAGCAYGQ